MAPLRSSSPRLTVLIAAWCLLPLLTARAEIQPPIILLGKANVLPLALEPTTFQFRKMTSFFLESPEVTGTKGAATENQQSIFFERQHLLYGAISGSDTRDRYGDYYTFFWRATRRANLTVRLEYRQQKLGGMVQAREVDYPNVRGNHATHFTINGDDYLEQGRVSAWRVLLIKDHQVIVALSQSYLWR